MTTVTIAHIQKTAKLLKTEPALNIADVKGKIDNQHSSVVDRAVLMDNGDLLFSDLSPQGIKRAQNSSIKLKGLGVNACPRPTSEDVIKIIVDNGPTENQNAKSIIDIGSTQELSRTQVLFRQLLVYAHKYNTSDVHIETNDETDVAKLRIRIDGELTYIAENQFCWPASECTSVASTLVAFDAQGKWDVDRPIDSSCEVKINSDITIPIRYSHVPIKPKGLSIAIRLFDDSSTNVIPSFEELGYSESEQGLLKIIFRYPFGLVLFTGPTGSGKSTAMQAGISRVPDTKKVITFEDPVEKIIPGACQVEINKDDKTRDLPNYARIVLRQNPNVIVYGESRDLSILNHASEQADTGHLVLTTLHTNGAPEAVDRMHAMGMAWVDIAKHDHLRAIIAQRLVPKLCNSCKLPLHDAIERTWATDDHLRIWNYFKNIEGEHEAQAKNIYTKNNDQANACKECDGRGHIGRRPMIEIVILSEKDRDYISKGDVSGWIQHMKSHGWERMTDKAHKYIFRGEICPLATESYVSTPFGIDSTTFDYRAFDKAIKDAADNRIQMAMSRVQSQLTGGMAN